MTNIQKTILTKTGRHFFLTAVLLAGLFLSACANQPVRVSPITADPTGQYQVGKFVWFDLFTDDMAAITPFYQALFGWSFESADGVSQRVQTIFSDNTPIATAVLNTPENRKTKESRWLGYISVKDVDQISKIITANKGVLHVLPRNLPDRGRVAVATDPEGALFGLLTSPQGDPKDSGMMENQWMGSELWTNDVTAALGFYDKIAGYDHRRVGIGTDSEYLLLEKNSIPRAGVVPIVWENIKPDWLPYIAVSDVVATTEKVEPLGGRVLVSPDTKMPNSLVAIIADPSGAVFAIQELTTGKGDKQ
jgi:predicted enzyme related to lactoylglutathione lyase